VGILDGHDVPDIDNLIDMLTKDTGSADDKTGLHLNFYKSAEKEGMTVEEMSLDEYKSYIEDKVRKIPMHPSQLRANITIHITEKGIMEMKEKSEYEAYVLTAIQMTFNQDRLSPMSEHCLLYFGTNEDESYGLGWSSMNGLLGQAKRNILYADHVKEMTHDGRQYVNTDDISDGMDGYGEEYEHDGAYGYDEAHKYDGAYRYDGAYGYDGAYEYDGTHIRNLNRINKLNDIKNYKRQNEFTFDKSKPSIRWIRTPVKNKHRIHQMMYAYNIAEE